jgi:hypothetical protein
MGPRNRSGHAQLPKDERAIPLFAMKRKLISNERMELKKM